jgi:Sugar-transfer associated ATP-grasp
MASLTPAVHHRPLRTKQRVKDFGRGVTYKIAGLPIAVRHSLGRRGQAPDQVLRRAYSRRYWHPRGWSERAQLALALLIWPFVLVGLQISFTLRSGGAVARGLGRPVRRQLVDQLRLYLGAGVLPPWYYIFELHRRPSTGEARDFIYRWESKAGFLQLLKEDDRAPATELNNKALFAEHCREHQIRTAPVLAVLTGGDVEYCALPAEFDTDLFVKPVIARGGKGAQRWDLVEPATYRSTAGETLSRGQLCGRLCELSRKASLLVQQRLKNHPELQPLNNGALSTVRVLTCLNEQGEPEVMGAAMRMAIGANHVVDNLHAGGIATAVDLETGALGPASNLGADARLGWMDRHPVSGAQITGTRLPMWEDVKDFAVRAHGAFADRVIVGWDIAITPDGPVLVEGNGAPDLDIMQRFVRHGLMAARLGILLAFHVSQLGLDQLPLA